MLSKHNFAGALEATLGGKHPYRQHGNGINWISGLFPHWSANCTMEWSRNLPQPAAQDTDTSSLSTALTRVQFRTWYKDSAPN